MKKLSVISAILLSAACACAQITPFSFLNGFSGLNEVGPNASTGTGTINTLSYDASVGAFGQFTVDISFVGLTTNPTGAHIHGYSGPTANSGVLQGLTYTAATSGSVTGVWNLPSAAAVTNLFDGLTYINLHSSTFPGGELRGQLVPIPEPSTVAFLMGLTGLAAVMVWRRRK